MKKFIIVDGNSFAYRAFFALPVLSTKDGLEIHAVYGFFHMLLKILKEYQPEFIAIAFDHPGPTIRHKIYEKYKEKREIMPESLQNQIKIIKNISEKSKMKIFELPGFEADDIIASIVYFLKNNENLKILIASSDKDLIQLLSENISIIKFTKDGYNELTPEKIKNEQGITPEQIIDILSLMGDSSDNVPGVKGIGEKTALKLIKEFNNIENLIQNLEKVKPERIKNLLKNEIENIKLSKELVTLKYNEEIIKKIEFNLDDCLREKIDFEILNKEFLNYNFKSLISSTSFEQKIIEDINISKKIYFLEEVDKETLKNNIEKAEYIVLFFNGENEEKPEMFTLNINDKYYYTFKLKDEFFTFLKEKIIITNSAKQIFKRTENTKNIYDLMLLAYLLNPDKTYKNISLVFTEYLSENFLSYEDVVGKGAKKISPEFAEKSILEKFVFMQLENTVKLRDILLNKIKKEDLLEIYEKIELPISRILAEMEIEGIRIDNILLDRLIQEIIQEIKKIEEKIYELADIRFNINSPKQLADVLFNKLNLPVKKKIKTGFSTDNEVLQELLPLNEIIGEILKYRTYVKYKTSFLDTIKSYLDRNNKIYPVYHQNKTATGRLSSSEPNIQNIPIKDEKIREIRKIFIPFTEDSIILKSDYSQIELRILAHISNDDNLINIFKNGGDVHTMVASQLFQLSPDKINRSQRRVAKTINFGIIYGMSPYGLSKELNISQSEAKIFIEKFFKTYPKVKEYQENIIKKAKERGYVETIFGRKRFIPNILSQNKTVRELSERAAINAPIQGTAADIIKLAMIEIFNQLKKNNLKTKFILQIHDELVFSVPENEKEIVIDIVKNKMQNIIQLNVPLIVEIGTGKNWYECG